MKPAIIGISGLELSPAEAALLQAKRPLGVILFSRNVSDPEQLARLVTAIRAVLPEA